MNINPSKKAIAEVTALAQDAAKNDNWMTPVPEEHEETEFSQFALSHQEGWQSTCHWEHYYGNQISDICDVEEAQYGKLKWEDRWYGLYEPLRELFWEVWEEEIKLYEKWTAYQKEHKNA